MKLERMIAIIMLLLQREKMGGKELAGLFEVSLRTIYRDIETINQAGIPIVTRSGVGGGIGIMNEYKIEKGFFTVKDITALLMGLGFISNTLSGEETTAPLAKVKSFIPEDKQHEITLKANQISFDLSAWLGSNDLQTKVEVIRTTLEHCSILSFMYQSAKGDKVMRTLEPHRLLLKENHWYVQGYCLNRQQFRVFKLSRISELERTEDRFVMREIPPAFSEFTDTMSRKMQKIKLQLDHSILDRLLDYCGEENITPLGNGQFYAYFDFIEDDYGYGILMSFGDKCQCIEPEHVRNEMKRRLNDSIRAYY
ncbi:helix-turn-helix transcriptional regulator [Paenibacillus etheri]|uniref:Transcriptional regulator n=1 Tax=Paenibacillus etheri TaxID=1306852 RepID=A0A0W1AS35_9BACL|nr:YafY family protein [Paenibacillus etheri]KTD84150.1 transcriptional regulator [Paenibacillus etheri]